METKNIISYALLSLGCVALFNIYFGPTITKCTLGGLLLLFAYYTLRGEKRNALSSGKNILSPNKWTAKPRTPPTIKRKPMLKMKYELERKIKEVGKRFDPTKSTVSTHAMLEFLEDPRRSKDMEFEDFPGIGPKLAQALRKDGIANPRELIRKFKGFVEESDRTGYNCNRMYDYFHSLPSRHPRILKGHANWHTPVFAVASYADEKCSWYTYDANDSDLQTIAE